jgi:hypothetical protein
MNTRKITGKGKTKPKARAKAAPAKSVRTAKPVMEGYRRQHKAGSRKSTIHELFDREGDETAWTRGLKIGLKEATLRTWFAHWRRQAKPAKGKKTAKSKTNSVAAPTSKSGAATPAVAA